DLFRHPLVEPLEAKPDTLGILPRRKRCRADEIGEQHGGQLSFRTNDRVFGHGWIVTPPQRWMIPGRESRGSPLARSPRLTAPIKAAPNRGCKQLCKDRACALMSPCSA